MTLFIVRTRLTRWRPTPGDELSEKLGGTSVEASRTWFNTMTPSTWAPQAMIVMMDSMSADRVGREERAAEDVMAGACQSGCRVSTSG